MEISFKKYLLSAAVGFGIGGAIWGGILYKNMDSLESPFYYLMGIILGLLCGISLTIFSRNIRLILITSVIGIIGFVVGFGAAAFGAYHLYVFGSLILSPLRYIVDVVILNSLFNLEPALSVGDFFLNFVLAGMFIGLFFALALKTKIWPVVWRGGVGFGFGSLVGPIIGNVMGFGSLLASYLITFAVIGIVLVLFLAWGVYRNIRRSNLQ